MHPCGNKNWVWQMTNKFMLLHSSLPTEALRVVCSAFQALYAPYSPYSLLVFHSWRLCELLNSIVDKNLIFALHMFNLSIFWCTLLVSVLPDWIFELMSSLRSNYALYRGTMPLVLSSLLKTKNNLLWKTYILWAMSSAFVLLLLT